MTPSPLCQSCSLHLSIYTCPSCSHRSCSLPCVRSHKLPPSTCTGVSSPLWSTPVLASSWTWGQMMRDQSYLSGVGRKAEEEGRGIVKAGLIPRDGGGGGEMGEGNGERLDECSDKERKLVVEARREGVELVLMPKGMERRRGNASRWDYKEKCLEWTAEVVFQPPPRTAKDSTPLPPISITLQSQKATKSMSQLLTEAFTSRDRKGKGKSISDEESVWIKKQKDWLASLAPPPPASSETASPDPTLSTSTLPSSSSDHLSPHTPFHLLLSPYAPPSVSATSSTSSPSQPTKRPPKFYHLLSPSLQSPLSTALRGTRVLEYPTFSLWDTETLLRERVKGNVVILEREEWGVGADISGEREVGREAWKEGRKWGGEGAEGRTQDAGWGKRARVEKEEEVGAGEGDEEGKEDVEGEKKRVRLMELAREEMLGAGGISSEKKDPKAVVEGATGVLNIVDGYDSN